jgi:hypothetical protein
MFLLRNIIAGTFGKAPLLEIGAVGAADGFLFIPCPFVGGVVLSSLRLCGKLSFPFVPFV